MDVFQLSQQVERFRQVYEPLAQDGKVDAFGGMECTRIFYSWVQKRMPHGIKEFILEEAKHRGKESQPDPEKDKAVPTGTVVTGRGAGKPS